MAYEPNEFGYKDGLPSGDPDKVIKGSDFDVEFNAIKEALDSVDVDVNVDDVNGLEELLGNKADQSDLDSLSAELQQEITDREAADSVLQGNIDSLATNDLADVSSEGAEKDQFLIHNGTQWVAEDFHVETDLTFIAGISVSNDPAPTAEAGDVYLNNEEGVAGESWTGIAGKLVNVANAIGWSEVRSRWYLLGDVFSDVYWQQNGSDIYYDAGNVGIGTDDPVAYADFTVATISGDVGSTLALQRGATTVGEVYAERGTNRLMLTAPQADGEITFSTTSYTPSMTLDSTGNVGIGTVDPNYPIHLNKSDSSGCWLQFTNSATGTGSTDGALIGVDSAQDLRIAQYEAKAIRFDTSGTERMRISSTGAVGIGGEPGTRTAADYIDQAKAKIKSWTAAIKTKLDEEPKANKKAVTLEVTDDAFEVIPTENLVAEWMSERAIGGGNAKLQVAGAGYFSEWIQSGTGVFNSSAATAYLQIQGVNRLSLTGNDLTPATAGGINCGSASLPFYQGNFSNDLNASGIVASGKYFNVNNNGYIRGEYAGELRLQGGTNGFTFYNNQNNTELANLSNVGNLTVSGTVNGSTFQGEKFYRSGSGGFSITVNTILPAGTDGSASDNTTDLGRLGNRFKDAHFSGTIYGSVDDVPSHVKAITPTQIANWDAGTGGGSGGSTTDGRITDTQITNWDQAHGWGNHATAGYQPAGNYADANHNHSGVYQPVGNYETAGTAYTKTESDGKYELKGQGGGGLPAGDWACNGSITATGNITAYYSSDERLKDDITAMPIGLIDSIEPVTWKWKENGKDSGGVVAQQLQACGLDDWVNEAPNGDLGVDYNALIGMLIAEVKSLKAEVEALKS